MSTHFNLSEIMMPHHIITACHVLAQTGVRSRLLIHSFQKEVIVEMLDAFGGTLEVTAYGLKYSQDVKDMVQVEAFVPMSEVKQNEQIAAWGCSLNFYSPMQEGPKPEWRDGVLYL
jgi:hypothetical protein